MNGLNNKIHGEAKTAYKALMSFKFVFNLHLMDEVMRITNVLCKQFQLQSYRRCYELGFNHKVSFFNVEGKWLGSFHWGCGIIL